jgi:hypothetical protein
MFTKTIHTNYMKISSVLELLNADTDMAKIIWKFLHLEKASPIFLDHTLPSLSLSGPFKRQHLLVLTYFQAFSNEPDHIGTEIWNQM